MPTGIYPRTEEHKKKISLTLKKRYAEGILKIGIVGKPAWNKGLKTGFISKTPEETRKKVSHKMENHPNWKGGKTTLNNMMRKRAMYSSWRDLVFIRDNYACQRCGARNKKGFSTHLHAHHIEPFSKCPNSRYDINNGITMCGNCHLTMHSHKFSIKPAKVKQ